jgi:stromal membrane-associated protein
MWTIPKFAAATVAEELSTTGKAVENNTQSNSGIEDLFKDSPSLATPSVSEKPQKDVKNDIMSLFEKVCAFGIFNASFEHFI